MPLSWLGGVAVGFGVALGTAHVVWNTVSHRKLLALLPFWFQESFHVFGGLLFITLGVLAARASAHGAMNFATAGTWARTRPLRPMIRALTMCAGPDALPAFPYFLRRAERAIRRARVRYGSVPRFSHRQPALRRHAAQVVAKLRTVEAKLDTYPDMAKVELTAMLHEIAEQYSSGRLGSLLPAGELEGVEPARALELARLAVPAVLVPVALWVTGAGPWEWPAALGGMFVLSLALYGRDALEVLPKLLAISRSGGS
jgi:hypothetical protein